ncbi:hypothetical protein Tco_0191251 [Tanacetum coccineum]
MVFNSPCLTDKKELIHHEGTALVVINSPCYHNKELASPEQTATVPTGRVVVPTGRYVVPAGRVVVPTGRYVVPAGKVIIIVSPGRLSLVPTGRILSPGSKDLSRVGSNIINYQEPIPADFRSKCKLPLMELTSWTLTNPCRRFLVCPNRYVDPELDNEWYKGHLYGMYGQLHPHQIEDIATELTSHEQLIILQDDFAGLQDEVAQTQKNASFWNNLRKLVQRDEEMVRKLQALAKETEERADEKLLFIEKLKGNAPF